MKATTPKTITLTFTDSPLDQSLLKALCETSETEHRRPRTRQAKYLLMMALGLRSVDSPMQARLIKGQMVDLKANTRKRVLNAGRHLKLVT
jgi:hypothetical protein